MSPKRRGTAPAGVPAGTVTLNVTVDIAAAISAMFFVVVPPAETVVATVVAPYSPSSDRNVIVFGPAGTPSIRKLPSGNVGFSCGPAETFRATSL